MGWREASGRLALVAVIGAFVVACASSLEQADLAYARGEWDVAAEFYSDALDSSLEPAEQQHVEARLTESRSKAVELHLEQSRGLAARNQFESARAEASQAMTFGAGAEAQALLGEIDQREGRFCLEMGQVELRTGSWDAAVRSLTRAAQLQPSSGTAELLLQAKEQAERYHLARYRALVGSARAAMRARNWSNASSLFEQAHQHAQSPDSVREAEFCEAMRQAESAVQRGDEFTARQQFELAGRSGLDLGFVQKRMLDALPGTYDVTFHGAVILPFKPQTRRPWDGTGGEIANAMPFLMHIAGYSGQEGEIAGQIAADCARAFEASVEPPDCFPIVEFRGQRAGGEACRDENSYSPNWGLTLRFEGMPSSQEVVSVIVIDRDLMEHDIVGACRIPLGDLISRIGLREYRFFDASGRLYAEGVLVLVVSVQRVS